MSHPFLGEIRIFGFNFAPTGWAFCDGQLLSIAQNTGLFAFVGTTYGGNGITTFGLPDLRGRAPLHRGQGPGLSQYDLGQVAGAETVTLVASELPSHNHLAMARTTAGDSTEPNTDGGFATPPDAMYSAYPEVNTNGAISGLMSPLAMGVTGDDLPHPNMPPFTVVNYSICVNGNFPTRN